MIALGVAAWLDVITVTIAGTIFVGASLLIGGVLQIILANIRSFLSCRWRCHGAATVVAMAISGLPLGVLQGSMPLSLR